MDKSGSLKQNLKAADSTKIRMQKFLIVNGRE
jgi:hypothetical protein